MITTYRALRLVYRAFQIQFVQDIATALILIALVGALLCILSLLCVGLHGAAACFN